ETSQLSCPRLCDGRPVCLIGGPVNGGPGGSQHIGWGEATFDLWLSLGGSLVPFCPGRKEPAPQGGTLPPRRRGGETPLKTYFFRWATNSSISWICLVTASLEGPP